MGFFEIAVSVIVLLLAVIAYLLHKLVFVQRSSPDDPTGELKQKIFDTLTKVKTDLENTV